MRPHHGSAGTAHVNAPQSAGVLTGRCLLLSLPFLALFFVFLLGHYMTASARITELEFELAKCRIRCDGGAGDGSQRWKGAESGHVDAALLKACPSCPPAAPPCAGGDDSNNNASPPNETEDANNNGDGDAGKQLVPLHGSDLVQAGGAGTDVLHPGEEGWVFGLERVAVKTDNTVYDPTEDEKMLQPYKRFDQGGASPSLRRYGRSPVPLGSWKVRVGPNRYVTMDEVAFAYDVWFEENQRFQYTSWMGVFVQQDPMDAFAIQDMLWRVKPDLIVEVGTNTGGGAIFYATIMKAYNPNGKIVTLDVKEVSNWNVRNSHRCAGCVLATKHAWWDDGMITFIKGRVTDKAIQDRIERDFVSKAKTVLVIEDASHRYPDTLQNMNAIYKWVTVGSYMLVQDTKMDRFVQGLGKKYGNLKFGPMRSVDEFVGKHPNFVIDRRFEYLLYSQHHRGWLRRKS